MYITEYSNESRTGQETIAMRFGGVDLEVFTKYCLSKATDGRGGVWKMRHRMKADAADPKEDDKRVT